MLFALLAVASAISFSGWTAKHNKRFSAVEALRRKAIFAENRRLVAQHNAVSAFKLALEGPFAAMTDEEYRGLLGKRPNSEDAEVQVFAPHDPRPGNVQLVPLVWLAGVA